MSFPHYYSARAAAALTNGVVISSGGVESIQTAPPPEFGGPGDRWSPETLTVAAIADCMILTFKAVAKASQFPYVDMICDVQGKLDRQNRVTSFTEFNVRVRLVVPSDASPDEARRLLAKAKEHCLITNSLKAPVHLESMVYTEETAAVPVGAGL